MPNPRSRRSRFSLLPLPLAIALALGACSSPPEKPQDQVAAIQAARQGGYVPIAGPVQGWDATWTLGQQPLEVSWLAPAGEHGAAPLILYLPGLGESARSGELWRRAWAEAGYAVLSIQMPQQGRALYSSGDAQAGAFRKLAQDNYSQASLRQRITLAQAALAEAAKRGRAGDPALAGVDWDNWMVAGFDLGAQTAAALVGEHGNGEARLSALRPKAAILLSPYVESSYDTDRFTHIDVPVLSISGPRDEDPFSWIPSPQQRQVLWRGLQVNDSYLLTLIEADHALLGGELPRPMGGPGHGGERGGPGGGMARPLAFNEGGGEGRRGGPGEGPGGRHDGRKPGTGGGIREHFDPRQAAYVQAVTLAFLDSRLRRAAAASQWLDQNAATWLGHGAWLEKKNP
ncbi:alpha/beta hydrolase family protein [Pseudomonas sp. TUM22785]|uniref:alpha/beta hydrolase family protein n=1 Tax=Pseudomonas sp. TUM22785 TaxID=3019098 RepID=UPI002305848D|nr:alpha/beta hydrolase [Pseudomonas sp. TUM22785]WCD83050.1 alpha/beta hydrolase [Pseudomonas sp. TUM22785]